jgi:hypothetical protein
MFKVPLKKMLIQSTERKKIIYCQKTVVNIPICPFQKKFQQAGSSLLDDMKVDETELQVKILFLF